MHICRIGKSALAAVAIPAVAIPAAAIPAAAVAIPAAAAAAAAAVCGVCGDGRQSLKRVAAPPANRTPLQYPSDNTCINK